MPLKIVMLIFIAFIIFLGIYLLNHRTKIFIIFNAKSNPKLQGTMTLVAYALFVVAAFGLLFLFLLPKGFNYITLFLAVIIIFYFTLMLTKYNQE